MLYIVYLIMPKNTWTVPSETTPNKFYEITKVGDRFVCSCPDCLYREHDCKHILKLKERLEEEKNKLKEEIEDKMDEVDFSMKEVIERHKRILKNKEEFIPLEEI